MERNIIQALELDVCLVYTTVAGTASAVQFVMAESDASSGLSCWSSVNDCIVISV